MNRIQLALIIVVYNEKVNESKTYCSLIGDGEIESEILLFVADNSTDESVKKVNKEFCVDRFTYVDMGGNKGIPYAYNRCIEIIEKKDNVWIMTCDQDTTFPQNYLENIKQFLNDTNRVYAPTVFNDYFKMSPNTRIFNRRKLYYINSGMIYNASLFNKIRFNEKLFLDNVDIDIINQLYENNIDIKNVDISIKQSFSGVTHDSIDSTKKRYMIFLKDSVSYMKTWKKDKKGAFFYLLRRTIRLSVEYKSLFFIREYIEYIRTSEEEDNGKES